MGRNVNVRQVTTNATCETVLKMQVNGMLQFTYHDTRQLGCRLRTTILVGWPSGAQSTWIWLTLVMPIASPAFVVPLVALIRSLARRQMQCTNLT